MSIIKNLEIKISNGEARLNENVYVYQHDRGVELRFKLNLVRTNYRSAIRSSLFETEAIFAAATILKPNGELIARKKIPVADDTVTFTIDREFTDQVDEIGTYMIQFHLFDTSDNRITIPPVSFEVKELLGILNDSDLSSDAIVDAAYTDSCYVCDDEELEIFSNGKYIKTVWKVGDLISSAKLNKIEEAIESLDNVFHIGEKPLYKDPVVWVDLSEQTNSILMGSDMEYELDTTVSRKVSDNDGNIYFSYKDNIYIDKLSDMLKTVIDRIDILEKELKLLKDKI